MLFRFSNPFALLLLLLPVMYWGVLRFLPRLRNRLPFVTYSDLSLLGQAGGWRVRWRRLPDVLRLLAWIVLVFVIARPQSGNEQEVIRGQGIDIVMALDISSSMETADIPPTRLESAKTQIEQFIQGREFDRVGLVVFAADAFHYVPPTLDYEILTERLQRLASVSSYTLAGEASSGTAIGTGIISAANMLRDSDAASRIIVLLTDGANNAGGVSPLDAARAAAAVDVRVYTIGMGRGGTTSVIVEDEVQTRNSDFDEDTLQQIAEITGGSYFRAEDNVGLRRTYEQIDTLERTDVERQVFVRWRERPVTLLLLVLGLLLIERVLRQTLFQTLP